MQQVINSQITVSADTQIAIVVARFNKFINDHLLIGAQDTLLRLGHVAENHITTVWVPGAYELPLIVKIMLESKKYQAVIALATVIRGATPHFDYVAGTCSAGLADIAMQSNTPVAFGVLTTDTVEQAIERAGTKAGNKGMEAALTALEMINLIKDIKGHK